MTNIPSDGVHFNNVQFLTSKLAIEPLLLPSYISKGFIELFT